MTPLALDVTDRSQIQRAAEEVGALDVLINNAGVALYDDLIASDAIEQHLAVNLLGPLNRTRAFLPSRPITHGKTLRSSRSRFGAYGRMPSSAFAKAF